MILVNTLAPLILYEFGTVGFYLFIIGTDSWEHVHQVAWSQDLAYALVIFSVLCFFLSFWEYFLRKEIPKKVNKYKRPSYEKYEDQIKDWI